MAVRTGVDAAWFGLVGRERGGGWKREAERGRKGKRGSHRLVLNVDSSVCEFGREEGNGENELQVMWRGVFLFDGQPATTFLLFLSAWVHLPAVGNHCTAAVACLRSHHTFNAQGGSFNPPLFWSVIACLVEAQNEKLLLGHCPTASTIIGGWCKAKVVVLV